VSSRPLPIEKHRAAARRVGRASNGVWSTVHRRASGCNNARRPNASLGTAPSADATRQAHREKRVRFGAPGKIPSKPPNEWPGRRHQVGGGLNLIVRRLAGRDEIDAPAGRDNCGVSRSRQRGPLVRVPVTWLAFASPLDAVVSAAAPQTLARDGGCCTNSGRWRKLQPRLGRCRSGDRGIAFYGARGHRLGQSVG